MAADGNSHVVDKSIGLTSNSKLPSNLSSVDSQDIGVGGIYVRTNTLTFSASGAPVTNDGPYNRYAMRAVYLKLPAFSLLFTIVGCSHPWPTRSSTAGCFPRAGRRPDS